MARPVQRIRDAFFGAHAGSGSFRVGDQAKARPLFKPPGDLAERLVGDAVDRVIDRGIPAGTREHHGPGAADQARSDDGNARHQRFLSLSLPAAWGGISKITSTTSVFAARDRGAAA